MIIRVKLYRSKDFELLQELEVETKKLEVSKLVPRLNSWLEPMTGLKLNKKDLEFIHKEIVHIDLDNQFVLEADPCLV